MTEFFILNSTSGSVPASDSTSVSSSYSGLASPSFSCSASSVYSASATISANNSNSPATSAQSSSKVSALAFASTKTPVFTFASAFVLALALITLLSMPSCTSVRNGDKAKYNVLFIICDDLNDWVEGMGGHPQTITPNIKKLAQSGIMFTNAHSNDPVCAPSRASLFTGIYPHSSGLYSFERWMLNPILQNCKTIMEHFRDNGYLVLGTGKLLHHNDTSLWDEFGNETDYGPYAFNGDYKEGDYWNGLMAHPNIPAPFRNAGALDGSFGPLSDIPEVKPDESNTGYTGWWKGIGPFHYEDENRRDLMPDEENAQWVVNKLKQIELKDNGKPFFLAVGFIRPHTPLYAPKKYFDMFPLENIRLPEYMSNDLEDCADDLVNNNGYPKGPRHYNWIKESYPVLEDGLKRYVQAYLACIAFVDAQIGIVLNALENSPFKDNTVVILTSDHGYHLGEKDQIFKHTLWEESTRIPYIIKVPGESIAGSSCDHPVSLIDIYPTLIDICGLNDLTIKNDRGKPVDGYSLRPFIRNPQETDWEGPEAALTAIMSGIVTEGNNIPMDVKDQHFSIRSREWRYTLTSGGGEELYDHTSDTHEWFNLAGEATYSEVKKKLRQDLLKMTGRTEE
jgi:arylsulfatase A-like enzyme